MPAQIENLINVDDTVLFSVNADAGMSGAALTIQGVWYSIAELTQIQAMLDRAKQHLTTNSGE